MIGLPWDSKTMPEGVVGVGVAVGVGVGVIVGVGVGAEVGVGVGVVVGVGVGPPDVIPQTSNSDI